MAAFAGPLKSLTYGNGLALARSYDRNHWLTGVALSGGAGALLDVAFTRDPWGLSGDDPTS